MSLTSLEANFSLGLTYFEINFIRDHLNSKMFCTVLLIQPDLRNVCICMCVGDGVREQLVRIGSDPTYVGSRDHPQA